MGLVRSRARHVDGAGWPKNDDGHVDLPEQFWRDQLPMTGSAYRDWVAGTFRATVRRGLRDGRFDVVAYGVEFSDTDLGPLTGGRATSAAASAEPSPPTKAKGGGGRRRAAEWNDWIAALALLAADGKIQASLTQTELLKMVADKMAEWEINEMSRSTVQGAADRVLGAFRDEGIFS